MKNPIINWYKHVKAMPNLKVENPEDIPESEYKKTLEYFDESISPQLKDLLDMERKRKYLGHGSFGIAYDTENKQYGDKNIVEKITRDEEEKTNAEYLMQIQDDSDDYPIVKVYEQNILRSYPKEKQIFRIFMEKLEPLNLSFAVLIDAIDYASFDFMEGHEGNTNSIIASAYDVIMNEKLKYSSKSISYFHALSELKKVDKIQLFKDLYYALQLLRDLEKRLLKYGFVNVDIHGRNLGWRNGKLCILDLGAIEKIKK